MRKIRRTTRKWGPWERVGSSSQPGACLGVQEEAYPEGAPRECRVKAAFAFVHRGLSLLGGDDPEEEEGGDPSVLVGGGEACLCGEMLP